MKTDIIDNTSMDRKLKHLAKSMYLSKKLENEIKKQRQKINIVTGGFSGKKRNEGFIFFYKHSKRINNAVDEIMRNVKKIPRNWKDEILSLLLFGSARFHKSDINVNISPNKESVDISISSKIRKDRIITWIRSNWWQVEEIFEEFGFEKVKGVKREHIDVKIEAINLMKSGECETYSELSTYLSEKYAGTSLEDFVSDEGNLSTAINRIKDDLDL